MGRKKKETKVVKKNKVVASVVKKEVKESSGEDSKEMIKNKRDSLIAEMAGKLLTNRQLKRGGSAIRTRYSQEQSNWMPVIAEINELGKKLGLRPIGLGHIRG